MPALLQAKGYHTFYAGKYLNEVCIVLCVLNNIAATIEEMFPHTHNNDFDILHSTKEKRCRQATPTGMDCTATQNTTITR